MRWVLRLCLDTLRNFFNSSVKRTSTCPRPQILTRRKQDVDGHSDRLRNHNKHRQILKTFHVIQEEISQRYHDQHIPEDVWYQKSLAERYDIIQVTVNDVAAFFRGEISFNDNGEPTKTINIDVIQNGKFVSVYTVN